ncbi:unnamed protein product [Prunus brigantina]
MQRLSLKLHAPGWFPVRIFSPLLLVILWFSPRDSVGMCLLEEEMEGFHWHLRLPICLALETPLMYKKPNSKHWVSTLKILSRLLVDTPLALQLANSLGTDCTTSLQLEMVQTQPSTLSSFLNCNHFALTMATLPGLLIWTWAAQISLMQLSLEICRMVAGYLNRIRSYGPMPPLKVLFKAFWV